MAIHAPPQRQLFGRGPAPCAWRGTGSQRFTDGGGHVAKLPSDLLADRLRLVGGGESSGLGGVRGGTQGVRADTRFAQSAAHIATTARRLRSVSEENPHPKPANRFLRGGLGTRCVRRDRVANVGAQARLDLLVVGREPRVGDAHFAERPCVRTPCRRRCGPSARAPRPRTDRDRIRRTSFPHSAYRHVRGWRSSDRAPAPTRQAAPVRSAECRSCPGSLRPLGDSSPRSS